MNQLKKYFNAMLEDIFLSTANRLCIQLRLFCIAASLIAIIMTGLNCIKAEYALGLETGVGALVSILIYIHAWKTRKYLPGSLGIVLIFLGILCRFLISGEVEGFAALWFCLYPFICLFILDMRIAILFIILGLSILAAFMWTPLQQILSPVYTQNFLLRFPFLYIGNFAFALALNGFYSYTYKRLLQMNRKFEFLSNQDGLTKLSNRAFLEKYKQAFLGGGGGTLSAIMLDVDFFKQYNDTYGHIAGDGVLRAIADQIMKQLPEEHSVAARYGGEEFLILLEESTKGEAEKFARRILERVHNLKIIHGAVDGYVSASIGVSLKRVNTGEDFIALIKQADDALYRAKQSGRNRVIVC